MNAEQQSFAVRRDSGLDPEIVEILPSGDAVVDTTNFRRIELEHSGEIMHEFVHTRNVDRVLAWMNERPRLHDEFAVARRYHSGMPPTR